MANLIGRDTVFLGEILYQTFCGDRFTFQGKKWILVCNLVVTEFFDIIFDIFTVGGDDRAVVMVIGVLYLSTLIRNTRIEDIVNALADQPGHMTVGKLSRITFGFTWNGFNTKLVDLTIGFRRYNDPVSKLRKEGEPEWIVFVHI